MRDKLKEGEQNVLQKYLKSNWLMKRMKINDKDIRHHDTDSESEEGEADIQRSRAFKMISKMLVYENLTFCR